MISEADFAQFVEARLDDLKRISYRCCRRARQLAYAQPPLPVAVVGAEDFIPGPWRHNRHTRDCRQLAFDFDEPLPFGW